MRLNVYGHCRHYDPRPGGKTLCEKGVDIRAHVGGPNLGWLSRIPCTREQLFKNSGPVVPCELRDLPTVEEMKQAEAEITRLLDEVDAGRCPDCGVALVITDTPDVTFSACPAGHVSMRGCKRIGDEHEFA